MENEVVTVKMKYKYSIIDSELYGHTKRIGTERLSKRLVEWYLPCRPRER